MSNDIISKMENTIREISSSPYSDKQVGTYRVRSYQERTYALRAISEEQFALTTRVAFSIAVEHDAQARRYILYEYWKLGPSIQLVAIHAITTYLRDDFSGEGVPMNNG